MAELVDAIDSKSVVREGVPVRVRLGAPLTHSKHLKSYAKIVGLPGGETSLSGRAG